MTMLKCAACMLRIVRWLAGHGLALVCTCFLLCPRPVHGEASADFDNWIKTNFSDNLDWLPRHLRIFVSTNLPMTNAAYSESKIKELLGFGGSTESLQDLASRYRIPLLDTNLAVIDSFQSDLGHKLTVKLHQAVTDMVASCSCATNASSAPASRNNPPSDEQFSSLAAKMLKAVSGDSSYMQNRITEFRNSHRTNSSSSSTMDMFNASTNLLADENLRSNVQAHLTSLLASELKSLHGGRTSNLVESLLTASQGINLTDKASATNALAVLSDFAVVSAAVPAASTLAEGLKEYGAALKRLSKSCSKQPGDDVGATVAQLGSALFIGGQASEVTNQITTILATLSTRTGNSKFDSVKPETLDFTQIGKMAGIPETDKWKGTAEQRDKLLEALGKPQPGQSSAQLTASQTAAIGDALIAVAERNEFINKNVRPYVSSQHLTITLAERLKVIDHKTAQNLYYSYEKGAIAGLQAYSGDYMGAAQSVISIADRWTDGRVGKAVGKILGPASSAFGFGNGLFGGGNNNARIDRLEGEMMKQFAEVRKDLAIMSGQLSELQRGQAFLIETQITILNKLDQIIDMQRITLQALAELLEGQERIREQLTNMTQDISLLRGDVAQLRTDMRQQFAGVMQELSVISHGVTFLADQAGITESNRFAYVKDVADSIGKYVNTPDQLIRYVVTDAPNNGPFRNALCEARKFSDTDLFTGSIGALYSSPPEEMFTRLIACATNAHATLKGTPNPPFSVSRAENSLTNVTERLVNSEILELAVHKFLAYEPIYIFFQFFSHQPSGSFNVVEELSNRAEIQDSLNKMASKLTNALSSIDAGIIQQTALSGIGLLQPLWRIADQDPLSDANYQVLKENDYLRTNFILWSLCKKKALPRYISLKYANQATSQATWQVLVMKNGSETHDPLNAPTEAQLARGEFVYPKDLQTLIDLRGVVIRRLMEYKAVRK